MVFLKHFVFIIVVAGFICANISFVSAVEPEQTPQTTFSESTLSEATGRIEGKNTVPTSISITISKDLITVPSIFAKRGFTKANLVNLYDFSGFIPLWHDMDGKLTLRSKHYIQLLEDSWQDGLNPKAYGVEKLIIYRDNPDEKQFKSPIEADIFLSAALLFYFSDIEHGRARLSADNPEDFVVEPYHDSQKELLACLQNTTPEDFIKTIRPKIPSYALLREALIQEKSENHSELATALKQVKPEEIFLKVGQTHQIVPILRQFLNTEGFEAKQPDSISDPMLYDEILARAMRNYQFQYGLLADGVVGPKTIGFIQSSFDDRIKKLSLTLERLRWYQSVNTEQKHLLINIAGFYAQAFDNDGKFLLTMPVIIGTGKRRTPEMISFIPSITFAPYWMVPSKIARENVLEKLQEDPKYYSDMGFELFEHVKGERVLIDASQFDWKTIKPSQFPPFRLRQKPGPQNSLGPIRFNIVNNHDIFLHGTSHPELFTQTNRNLSSGCVRLKDPWQIVIFTTKNNTTFTENKLLTFYNKAVEGVEGFASYTIALDNKIPVHIVYWTSWADEKGIVHYANDIYERDEKLERVIKKQG